MAKQITNSIVMVRPIAFCFNTQTAANDFFQDDLGEKKDIVEAKASSSSMAHAWVMHPMAAAISAFLMTLAKEPPIKEGTPDPYTPPAPGEWQPQTHINLGPITQFVTSLVKTHDEPQQPPTGMEHHAG